MQGKGDMRTFWLTGIKNQTSPEEESISQSNLGPGAILIPIFKKPIFAESLLSGGIQNFHRACSIFVALELFRIKVSIFSVFTILSQIYSTLSVTNPNTLDVGKYQIENLATLVNFRKATVMWLQFLCKNLSILSQRF